MLRTLTTLGAAAALATGLLVMPASAATPLAAQQQPTIQQEAKLPKAAAACPITRYGKTGYYICGTRFTDKKWSKWNGSKWVYSHSETFIIGLNYQIYSITASLGRWVSHGGNARRWTHAYTDGYNRQTMQTLGSDYREWCRTWIKSKRSWDAWHRCDLVTIAMSQVGKKEASGDRYPKHYQIPGYGISYGVEWCGIFTHWVWRHGGATKIPRMSPSNNTLQGHWATYWQKWGKDNKRWKALKNAQPGDVVVYGKYDQEGHVGIVVARKVVNGRVYLRTVEGNSGNKVTYHKWRYIGDMKGNGLKATGVVSPR